MEMEMGLELLLDWKLVTFSLRSCLGCWLPVLSSKVTARYAGNKKKTDPQILPLPIPSSLLSLEATVNSIWTAPCRQKPFANHLQSQNPNPKPNPSPIRSWNWSPLTALEWITFCNCERKSYSVGVEGQNPSMDITENCYPNLAAQCSFSYFKCEGQSKQKQRKFLS